MNKLFTPTQTPLTGYVSTKTTSFGEEKLGGKLQTSWTCSWCAVHNDSQLCQTVRTSLTFQEID